jgi:hypothetical protein
LSDTNSDRRACRPATSYCGPGGPVNRLLKEAETALPAFDGDGDDAQPMVTPLGLFNRTQTWPTKWSFCRRLALDVWATGLGHEARACACYDNKNTYLQALLETGATGLEPATSGVTGRARGAMVFHPTTRKSPISRNF